MFFLTYSDCNLPRVHAAGTDGYGGLHWDLRDESGSLVASGIYLFYVVGEGKKAVGKFAIVH